MQSLRQNLTPLQASEISTEIKHLFALQDKPCTDAKVSILLQEIENLGLPYPAIVAGIKSLFHKDIKVMKLAVIVEAIREHITYDFHSVPCEYCNGNGAVCLFDSEGRSFALSCKCSNGDKINSAQKLVRWNGNDNQMSNNRILKFRGQIND